MSDTKKREPMLSDHEVEMLDSVGAVRDAYEYLITTGKLRVVEEVAANLEPMANEVTGASWREMSCCGYVIEGMEPGDVYVGAPFNYCPGCGNKIKR